MRGLVGVILFRLSSTLQENVRRGCGCWESWGYGEIGDNSLSRENWAIAKIWSPQGRGDWLAQWPEFLCLGTGTGQLGGLVDFPGIVRRKKGPRVGRYELDYEVWGGSRVHPGPERCGS